MQTLWLEKEFPYDGSQLRSLYAYLNHKLQGDSIVAWRGPCSISNEHMVDGEDLVAGEKICGDRMLHFVAEVFGHSLFAGVCLQRLLASLAFDILGSGHCGGQALRREGDDIYMGEKKLSISVATQTPVSSLIHFAVNLTNKGTPVPTLSLEDLDVDPKKFANQLMKAFSHEFDTISVATKKVRPVL